MNECFENGQELRVPITPVQAAGELVTNPQYMTRQFFKQADHPIMGKVTYPGLPFKMTESPGRAGRAPLLGEWNEEVYCHRLSLSKEELILLKEKGII